MTADPSSSRWDWLLLAVITATLASLTRWAIAQPAVARSRIGPVLNSAVQWPWLVHPLRLAHAVGIPACALYWQHALSAKGLGLKPLPSFLPTRISGVQLAPGLGPWVQDVGSLGLLTVAIAALIALGDRAARHWDGSPSTLYRSRNWSIAAREGIVHQVRWAFYREPFVFVWGPAVGAWLGTLPILLEALVSPTFWGNLRSGRPACARATVVRAGFLVGSVLIYLSTRNLWMAIAMNVVLEWLLLPDTPSPPPAMP